MASKGGKLKFRHMLFRLRGETAGYQIWDRVCVEDGSPFKPNFMLILDPWGKEESPEHGPKVKHQRGEKL